MREHALIGCDGGLGSVTAQWSSFPIFSVTPKIPWSAKHLSGTLHIEWPSIFVPFIIFLIDNDCFFSWVLLHTSPCPFMEAKVLSFGSRFPLEIRVPCNCSQAARIGSRNGARFALGCTLTVS